MRILGAVPVYDDSPLDGLWLELAKHHKMTLWGEGREGYRRGTPLRDVAGNADLVLLADPARKGSEWWDARRAGPKVAAVFVDSCYDRGTRIQWVKDHGIPLVLLRAKDDVAAYQAALPEARVEWLPFGFDPDVFRDCHEPKRYDVVIAGHLGAHNYPVRERARRVLREQLRPGVLDLCVRGDWSPRKVGRAYAQALSSARIGVVASNVYGHVVQKYFEVPAVGTALVCQRARHGFDELFAPGEDCVLFRDDCSDLVRVIRGLLSDADRLRRLTDAGCARVTGRHANDNRVVRLERILGWRDRASAGCSETCHST